MTIAEWKEGQGVTDLPTSPKWVRPKAPSVEDEAVIVAFRKHTLLSSTIAPKNTIV